MGELIDGVWHLGGLGSVIVAGELRRPPSLFRDWVTADGTAPLGRRGFRTSTSPWRVPGRTGRSSCAGSSGSRV